MDINVILLLLFSVLHYMCVNRTGHLKVIKHDDLLNNTVVEWVTLEMWIYSQQTDKVFLL